MNAPVVFGAGKRRLNLGTRIGRGGEGEVYALADSPNEAVKLYTVSDAQSRLDKILAMVAAGLAKRTSLVAFPMEVVTDQRGKFAGFTMAKVSGHKPLHELYAPGARKAEFPRADYRFLVRTAANVARAVADVHRNSCVIGDINHSGILISKDATVALIDADSFQVMAGAARYLCRVGVPEYTPPELQGQSLENVVRTADHDAFGLAVVIFQLLWMGRHPYSGSFARGEMPIEKAIAEHRFVYSERRAGGMTPPPSTPKLSDFPPPIRAAFERAFDGPGGRPSARDWVSLLEELERSLRSCTANRLHHYAVDAPSCPWCRMENATGVPLFLAPIIGGSGDAGSPLITIDQLWRAIEAVERPLDAPPATTWPLLTLKPTPGAVEILSRCRRRRLLGFLIAAVFTAVAFWQRDSWLIWAAIAGGGGYLLLSDDKTAAEFINKAREWDRQFGEALARWSDASGPATFENIKADLCDLKAAFDQLPHEQNALINAYNQNRRAEQLRAYLQSFQIRRYKLRGIGPSKVATLTSYGIETAFDVAHHRVLAVPGFGPVMTGTLVEWRQRIEARFVYNPNATDLDRRQIAGIKAQIAARAQALHAQIAAGSKKLSAAAAAAQVNRSEPDPEVKRLYEKRCQAEIDLKLFHRRLKPIVIPKPSPAPPRAARPAFRPTVASRSAPNPAQSVQVNPLQFAKMCPRCGSSMVLRTARRGRRRGHQFWGCARYPTCSATRPYP